LPFGPELARARLCRTPVQCGETIMEQETSKPRNIGRFLFIDVCSILSRVDAFEKCSRMMTSAR